MRIWIELQAGEIAKVVPTTCTKHTPLQSTSAPTWFAIGERLTAPARSG